MSERHNFTEFRLPLSLEERPFRSHRKGPRVNYPRSRSDRHQYAQEVMLSFESIIFPTVLNTNLIHPELIFKIPPAPNAYLSQRILEKKYHFSILGNEYDGTVVIFSTKEAVDNFKTQIEQYGSEYRENDYYNPHETFGVPQLISDDERIGSSLLTNPLRDTFEEVDIFLWYFGSGRDIRIQTMQIMQEISNRIKNLNGEVIDSNIIEEYVIVKAKINNFILDLLKKEPSIRIIERTIIFQPQFPINLRADISELNFFEPATDFGILVLDEAIMPGNPFIAKTIAEYKLNGPIKEYSENRIDHGTAVSCIALYGDLQSIISSPSRNFIPIGKLYFGSIWNPRKNIIENVQETLDYFIEHYPNIKIVNICMATGMVIDNTRLKQMPIAGMLDLYQYELARKGKDIIFVISMGNFIYQDYQQNNQFYRNFRNVVHNFTDNKIVDPSSSALSLSIGSVCLGENIPATYYNESSLCKEHYPSPFSRTGPSVNDSFKPDFVDFGSDSIRLASESAEENRPGVLTINSTQYGPFSFDEGTSFSTPLVTNKIAELWQLYPDLHSNSIKCLIAIGSNFHKNYLDFFRLNKSLKKLKEPDFKKILNLFGFGQIDINKSEYSNRNWVVLLQERQLAPVKFDLFDIPIPNEFFTSGGRKKITIAIAYNPPTKESRTDYLGIELDYYIFKNVSNELLSKYYEKIIRPVLENESSIELNDVEEGENEFFSKDIDEEENEDNQDYEFQEDIGEEIYTIEDLLELDLSVKEQRDVFSNNMKKYQIKKFYPNKSTCKKNCLKKHTIEYNRRIPPPNEYGYKILLYPKYSQTKWYESIAKSINYKQPYSIVVGLECQENIELRTKIRDKLQIRAQQRITI